MINETFYERFSPIARKLDENYLNRIKNDLIKARMKQTPVEYVSFCAGISLTIGVFSLLSFAFISTMVVPVFLIITASSFLILSRYPSLRKITVAKQIEKEMRTTLRFFAIQLRIGVSFEKAMEKIEKSGYKVLSREFSEIMRDVRNGESVPSALNSFSERTHSRDVRKMSSALAVTYAKGGDGTLLRKIMAEQNATYRIRLKEYNAKMMMFSLLFIGVGAIAPALFQATFTLGSVFMDFGVSPVTAFVIIVVVFPSINALLLWWLNWKKP